MCRVEFEECWLRFHMIKLSLCPSKFPGHVRDDPVRGGDMRECNDGYIGYTYFEFEHSWLFQQPCHNQSRSTEDRSESAKE